MARAVSEIEDEIRGLAPGDQERLLRVLLEELEGPADPEVERAWLEEVRRRSREIDEGGVTPVAADEVFAKTRAELERG